MELAVVLDIVPALVGEGGGRGREREGGGGREREGEGGRGRVTYCKLST